MEQGYAKLYRKTYAPEEYTKNVLSIVDRERRRWGLDRRERDPAPKPVRGQLALSLGDEPPTAADRSTNPGRGNWSWR